MDPLSPPPSFTERVFSTEALATPVELPLLGPLVIAITALIVGLMLIYRRRYPGLTPILIGVLAVGALFGVMGLLIGTVD